MRTLVVVYPEEAESVTPMVGVACFTVTVTGVDVTVGVVEPVGVKVAVME